MTNAEAVGMAAVVAASVVAASIVGVHVVRLVVQLPGSLLSDLALC
jgi:hypothetical protein